MRPKESENFTKKSEHQHAAECTARYTPYYVALGIDVSAWGAWDLWKNASIIWDHPEVRAHENEKAVAYRRTLKPVAQWITTADYVASVPPDRLCVEAIQELPEATKAEIRQRVLAAKAAA